MKLKRTQKKNLQVSAKRKITEDSDFRDKVALKAMECIMNNKNSFDVDNVSDIAEMSYLIANLMLGCKYEQR